MSEQLEPDVRDAERDWEAAPDEPYPERDDDDREEDEA